MKFEWQSFYEELADELVSWHDKRQGLLEKIMLAHNMAGLKFPVAWKGWSIDQIDPFSIFAFINRRYRDVKKTILLEEIKKVFGLESDVPMDFSGIPQFDNRNPFLFAVDDHVETHIDDLWMMFKVALDYSDGRCGEKVFAERYTALECQKHVAYGLTIGLFCMRPDVYVNLDKRNRTYIFAAGKTGEAFQSQNRHIVKDYKDGVAYLNFCRALREEIRNGAVRYEGFPVLSLAAYEWDIANQNAGRKIRSTSNLAMRNIESDRNDLKALTLWLGKQTETVRRSSSMQRIGQDKLRQYLLSKYKRCPITQINRPELLVASHIKGWRECREGEQLDPENVLLLAKNYDAVFDRHLISFDAIDGHLIKAKRIQWEELLLMGVSKEAKIPRPSSMQAEFLLYHQRRMAQKDAGCK